MKLITQFLLAPALALGLTTTAAMAQVVPPTDVQLTLVPALGTSTTVGGSLTYNLNITNLQANPDAPQALGAYDIFVNFNPTYFTVVGGTIGGNLIVDNEGDLPFTGTASPGQFELSDVSLDSNSTESHQGLGDFSTQAKSFTIGTITLSGVANGTSALSFDATSSLSDQNSNTIVFGTTGSTIAAVPEPSSIGLGLVAMVLAMVLVNFRRRSV